MDYKKIWKKTDEDLKSSLPAHAYEAWIETLSPVGITNDIFIVEARQTSLHMTGLLIIIRTSYCLL